VEQPRGPSASDEYPRDAAWRGQLRAGDPLDARDREGKWFESVVAARGALADVWPPLAKRAHLAPPQRAALEHAASEQPAAAAVVVHFKVTRARPERWPFNNRRRVL
jgi:hypothetical protein